MKMYTILTDVLMIMTLAKINKTLPEDGC